MISYASLSRKQQRDSGLALAFGILIFGLTRTSDAPLFCAIGVSIAALLAPAAFKPFAWVWWNFSLLVGAVVSRLLLGAVFFVVITPIAIARRLLGSDPLKLRQWKAGPQGVFHVREHTFSASDLENPF